jgi:serine/threonine-protein kinase
LFEILTGERLLPRTLGTDPLDARASVRAPSRDIAPELDDICVRATAIARDQRIASARDLALAVERFLDGDRDLDMRRRLAREHLAGAEVAFAASSETDSHRTAMRLAGRALALDPTLVAAAELVSRLMLEPPRDIPNEVAAALAEDHVLAQRRNARVGLFAYVGYILVFAMLAGVGFSAPIYPMMFSALIVINIGLLWWHERSSRPRNPLPLLIASGLLVGTVARMFSPFLVGPSIAAVTAMAFTLGMMPTTRAGVLATIGVTTGAVLLPWIGEEVGLLSRSLEITAKELIMSAPGIQDEEPVQVVVFAVYTLVLVVAAVLMAYSVRRSEAEARRSLHLQAWQLRQLVPLKGDR